MFPQADILNVDSLASQGFWVLNPVNHQNTRKNGYKWPNSLTIVKTHKLSVLHVSLKLLRNVFCGTALCHCPDI